MGVAGQTPKEENTESAGSDSLVHVAYSTVDKRDLPGAISVLNPTEYLNKHYGTYPLDGTSAFIGGENLWDLGDKLILIDGVPRAISDITSTEIEQITFLKGANAVVLYGSRAANGVILITSKRGSIGDRKSNIRVNAGINVPKAYPNFLGSAEYMKYYNQACLNDGLEALYDDETINNYASHADPYRYPDVDYFSSDFLRKFSNSYSANAEFSGGSNRARFYATTGIERQNSLLKFGEGKNENNTRFNVRGNIDLKLNDYISTYVNVSTVFSDSRSANGRFWSQIDSIQPHRFSPLIPIDMIEKNATDAQVLVDGSRHIIDGKYLLGGSQEYLTNPISDVYAAGYKNNTSRQFQYTEGVDVNLMKLLKGLSFHTQMSVDYSNSYIESIDNTYAVYVPDWNSYSASDSIGVLTKYNKDRNTGNQNLSNNWNNQLIDFNAHFDYANTFKEKHNVSAMLVASGSRSRQTGDYQYRTNTNLGLQVSYNYAHKYFADFSGAIVSSTKLSENNRVAISPTLSLGWVLSDEDFLKGSSVVNRLKLTASAGIVNTDLDFNSYYLYDANYSPTAYFSWCDGSWVSRATTISRDENKNLTYAKRKEANFGIEGSLLNETMNFQATAFYIKKDGIPVQSYTLYPSFFKTGWPETSFVPYTNFEANSYKGFDFQVSYNKKMGEVHLNLGLAGTYVVKTAEKRDEMYADSYRNRAGKALNAIFGLENEGFFMNQADIDNHAVQKFGEVKPGDIKYKDQNNDGVVDERDEVLIGHWNSPFTCGLHLTAQWKNFTLFALGTGSFGGTAIKNGSYYWVYGNNKYSEVVRNSWTEETKNTADYPRLTTLSGDNNFRYSDFWTYSTNRVDLSKVQLTYSLPENFFKNSFIKSMNVYVSGADLLTISKNKELLELNIAKKPQNRFFNLGVKAVF